MLIGTIGGAEDVVVVVVVVCVVIVVGIEGSVVGFHGVGEWDVNMRLSPFSLR